MRNFLVVISSDFIRDAQRYDGEEDCDDVCGSDDWCDVFGDMIVDSFSVENEEELEKKKEEFGFAYPRFTLNFIEII